MTLKNNFVISEGIFARRLAHGPLNGQEARYRAFLSCEFHEFLDVDPWLTTAWPTARGRRILVPLIRQVLRHQGELPNRDDQSFESSASEYNSDGKKSNYTLQACNYLK